MTAKIAIRANEVEWRQVDDEVVVLDLRTQRYLSVNASGAALWPLLTAGASRRQLAGELVRRYGIDAARAASDVDALLAQLAQAGLLEGEEDRAPAEP